jgi:pimeloyl-ACP methyl ester carboxylesterase
VSVARSLRRRISTDDPYAGEDFGLLDADRSVVVTTPDGVDLAVREVGPQDAPLTVVFAHGFCLRMGAFHFQRARLTEQWGSQVRMVFYDQRGHGQSATTSPDSYTVEQLGRDLETVLAVMAPRGPVVLVGHSMGGMTVLSHARQYPQRYPTRVVGAALIASAAEGVSRSPLGEILENPALEAARFAVRHAPKTVHRTRGAAKSVIGPILRAASYGDEKVSPSVVAFSEAMMHDTPIETLIEFLHALEVHDETKGLDTLAKVPTLVACGDHDLLTPMEYSQSMADCLPKSELVIVEGAGHLVQLEQPEVIDDALVRLVERATPSKLVALTRRVRERVRNHG